MAAESIHVASVQCSLNLSFKFLDLVTVVGSFRSRPNLYQKEIGKVLEIGDCWNARMPPKLFFFIVVILASVLADSVRFDLHSRFTLISLVVSRFPSMLQSVVLFARLGLAPVPSTSVLSVT